MVRVGETWIQKVKRGSNFGADPEKVAQLRKEGKGLHATGGDLAGGMSSSLLTKDTSMMSLKGQYRSNKSLMRGTSPSM